MGDLSSAYNSGYEAREGGASMQEQYWR